MNTAMIVSDFDRSSKGEREMIDRAKRGQFGVRPVFLPSDKTERDATLSALRDGRAEYSVQGAIGAAIGAFRRGANGSYLEKSRPFGFVREYDSAEREAIISDMIGDWFIRRSQTPPEGQTTCRFSFNLAAAKCDKQRNQGRGYWSILLSGIRIGGDGIPENIPMDRIVAREWRNTRSVMGYTDVEETRIGVRSFGDARRAALIASAKGKGEAPATFDTIDNRTVAEREAMEALDDIATVRDMLGFLTDAEQIVLSGMSLGLSMKGIADDIGIRPGSVSDTFSRVKRKVKIMLNTEPDTWATAVA
jgi:DNA-binding CsgD family transcriptional regulator